YRHRVLRCFGRGLSSPFGFLPQVVIWDYAASTWASRTDYEDDLPVSARRGKAGVAFDLNRDTLVICGGGRVDSDGTLVLYQDTWEEKFSGAKLFASSTGTSVHCEGETAVFALTAGGDNLTYEWFHNAVLMPGANFSTLVINAVTKDDAGNYVG